MDAERRSYFRIEDRALVKYRVIAEENLEQERRCILLEEIRTTNLHAALMGLDLKLQEQFDLVRQQSKAVADALELLNRKFTLLERVVASEHAGSDAVRYNEHQPTEVNLSGGGIAFKAPEPLTVQVLLAIDLILLPSNQSIRAIGRVADCRHDESGQYAVGVEFEDIRNEDRELLIQHVLRKQSADLREGRQEHAGHAA